MLGSGRPSLPFPHPWNYKTPIKIFEAFYCNVEKQTGSAKHNRYVWLGGAPPVLLTREPAIIKAILLATGDKPGQFDRDTSPTAGIARATGVDTLLYANGAVWRRQKKMAAKPFSRGNLFQPEEFHEFEQTFRATIAERLEALHARQVESGNKVVRVELEAELQAVMLELLVNNFFGGNVGYDELRDRYVPALVLLIDHIIIDTVAPKLNALSMLLTGRNAKLKRSKADFEALTDIALAGREQGLGLWKQFQSDSDNDAIRSNIRVFLAGALEATTSFAGWAISHLSRRPDLQEQIYEEVKDMVVYDPENLAQAKTLNNVLEETLRLTPSLYFFPRRATVDTWVETADGRKMFIPNGTHVRLDVWHANRCEEFWGKEVSGYPADEFAPERWDVLKTKGKSSKDILHFGFGYGARVCPGKFLGQLEVGLVVGALVQVFKFKAVTEKTGVRAGVSTKPDDGVLVDLELRQQS
jgi:cytochrome P450